MFRKQDVRFPADGGIELSAWLFLPEHHPRDARSPDTDAVGFNHRDHKPTRTTRIRETWLHP